MPAATVTAVKSTPPPALAPVRSGGIFQQRGPEEDEAAEKVSALFHRTAAAPGSPPGGDGPPDIAGRVRSEWAQVMDFAAARIHTAGPAIARRMSGGGYTGGNGVSFGAGRAENVRAEPPREQAVPGPTAVESFQENTVPEPAYFTEPGDVEEVEADRFADAALEVLAAPAMAPAAEGPLAARPVPALTRAAAPANEPLADEPVVEEAPERKVEAAPAGGAPADDGPPGDDEDPRKAIAAAGSGAPLAAPLRRQLEPVLGADLGRVRIHDDSRAHELSTRYAAMAFAHGSDVFFSRGAWAPGTVSGAHLLLHELAHVVQQGGAGRTPPVIARGPLSGPGVHKKVEDMLIEMHSGKSLMKEGVLPGGNRGSKDEVTKLGYPDLLLSSAGNKVPWVRGKYDDSTLENPTLSYVPLELDKFHGHPRSEKAKALHEPTVDAKGTFTGDFPTFVGIAEIKPAGTFSSGLDKIGEGLAQGNNYKDGFQNFTKRAQTDKKSKVVPNVLSLTNDKEGESMLGKGGLLPPAVDYRNFATDAENKKPAEPNLVVGTSRYWLYPQQLDPVLYYFDLPHPYEVTDYTKKLDAVFLDLDNLRKRLGKRTAGRWKARGFRRRQRQAQRIARKTDWKAEHGKWETDRKSWDDSKAKPFLSTPAAKAIEKKSKIDGALNLPAKDDSAAAKRRKEFRQVELFSGTTGKVLGDIRYALGPVFDKLEPFFVWLKKRMDKLTGVFKKGRTLSLSWAQTIVDVVLASLGSIVEEAVSQLFGKFQSCIGGMVDAFLDSFTKDLKEDLAKPFEEGKDAFFKWLGTDEATFGQLMTDIEASLKKYEEIADTVLDVKRLVDEIKVYEMVIRGIVQAASCVSPPLLGCLWGVAAQFALPAIIGVAMKSDTFQDKVVRPLVKDMVKDILDEPFSRIVSATVKAVGLGKWAEGVNGCDIKPLKVEDLITKAVTNAMPRGMKITDPAFKKERDAWAAKNREALLDAAVGKFVDKDGKPASREAIAHLMKLTGELVETAGGMDQALEAARRGDGKISIEKFQEWAQGRKAAPPLPPRQPGGFTDDLGRTVSAADVRAKLAGADLASAVPSRMTEMLEGSRDDDGRVNVDQFVRRTKMHHVRQQLKKDVEARHPDLPGVPKQPGAGFTKADGAKASAAEMAELVESLATANLGEASALEKVEAARREDGTVDAGAAKSAVDGAGAPAVASGEPSTGGGKPGPTGGTGSGGDAPAGDKPKDKPKGPIIRIEGCIGKECQPRSGGVKFGPQTIPGRDGQPDTITPGISIPLPKPFD